MKMTITPEEQKEVFVSVFKDSFDWMDGILPIENKDFEIIKCEVLHIWIDESQDNMFDNFLNKVRVYAKLKPLQDLPKWINNQDWDNFEKRDIQQVFYTRDAVLHEIEL